MILTTLSCCAVCPLVKCKSYEGSDKAARIYSRYNMSKSWKSFQFSYKIPMKKGTCGKKSHIFKTILILSTLLSSAVCPLVKCKCLEGSDKASRVYSGWNMSKLFKKKINSFRKIPMKKGTLVNNFYIFEPILILTT